MLQLKFYVCLLPLLLVKVNCQTCRTPDSLDGTCIAARDCAFIVDLLNSVPAPYSTDFQKRLRDYQCPKLNGDVRVCCPNEGRNIHSILSHKNIHLLPTDECGYFDDSNRITGGNVTGLNEFPWMALLWYKTRGGNSFACGGSLINERYILTAAHCVVGLSHHQLLGVRLGEHNTATEKDCEKHYGEPDECADPVQDVGIEEIKSHPGYDKSKYINDIALIRLRAPAKIKQENIQPICLPINRDQKDTKTIKTFVVTGWGRTQNTSKSDVLLKVGVPQMTLAQCNRAYQSVPLITPNQICAGGVNREDSCQGDSGGPLQEAGLFDNDYRYIQYGIVSVGHAWCGTEGYPGIYTNVVRYLDWILDNMRP